MRTLRSGLARSTARGQALVEFSLTIIIFLVLLMGVFDLGRGIYMFNGVSEAAREIARRTAVYPGVTLGQSTQTQAVVATQRGLVPAFQTPDFLCVDITGNANGKVPCQSGDYVRVTVTATYSPVTLLGLSGPINLTSSSSIRIP
ncbi:MAG: TadE/TadG family type IV pilus assembly protein [Chloroflexota bacterium]